MIRGQASPTGPIDAQLAEFERTQAALERFFVALATAWPPRIQRLRTPTWAASGTTSLAPAGLRLTVDRSQLGAVGLACGRRGVPAGARRPPKGTRI